MSGATGARGGDVSGDLVACLPEVRGESVDGGDVAVLERRLAAVVDELSDLRLRLAPDGYDAHEVRRCRALLREHTSPDDAVLIVARGDESAFAVDRRTVSCFPQNAEGAYAGFHPAASSGAIAHFEALRFAGHRFLLIPDSARWWCTNYRSWWQHLVDRATVIADEQDTGVLLGLGDTAPASRTLDPAGAGEPVRMRTLSSERAIHDVAVAVGEAVSVLDLTGRLGDDVPDAHCVFAPPAERLLYLDRSIDVVVADGSEATCEDDDSGHEGDEDTRRIARHAVVVVDARNGAEQGARIEWRTDSVTVRPVGVEIVCDDTRWRQRIESMLSQEVSVQVVERASSTDEVVLAVEPGVLPLPGCIRAMVTQLAGDDRIGGIGVKLFDAEGGLESVGDMVFADSTIAPIARGSFDTDAAWHDYVRDVCSASGLVGLRGDIASHDRGSAPDVSDLASAVWARGRRLVYQPEAHAVRVAGWPHGVRAAPEAWRGRCATRPAPADTELELDWPRLVRGDDPSRSWT